MKRTVVSLLGLLLVFSAGSCAEDPPPNQSLWMKATATPSTDSVRIYPAGGGTQETHVRPYFRDKYGRYLHINGVNVSGSNKWPDTEDFENLQLWKDLEAKTVTYVGKPFPSSKMDENFQRLQTLGFNAIRLVMNWESIQPYGPDQYDEEYLDYIEELVGRAATYGIYVLMDMHQDIFSRHLMVRYNAHPVGPDGTPYEQGSLEGMLFSLFPPYDDWQRGHGAPQWVVRLCLPEKNLDSPAWGTPKALAGLNKVEGLATLNKLNDMISAILGDSGGGLDPAFSEFLLGKVLEVEDFDITETSDVMPWGMWGVNVVLSLDIQRCFATLFAGDKIYPEYTVNGQSIQAYLEDQYTKAFVQVARRVKDKGNVIGYDLMNEPVGFFVTMALVAAYFQTGLDSAVIDVAKSLLGDDELGLQFYETVSALGILPTDTSAETREKWGFKDADLMAMVGLNYAYDANYLQPFFERVGKAIQDEDPNAIIWFESTVGAGSVLGGEGLGMWEVNQTRLDGIAQQVYAPHWYPDIYPFLGLNMPPRDFDPEEWRYRDFTPALQAALDKSEKLFANIPVVFGEFGTYFNYSYRGEEKKGIEASIDNDYLMSSYILDSYYRAFESLNMGNMVWCYSPENSYEHGEYWNHEDFSIIDPEGKPRSHRAYVRPHVRAASGQPISTHFYSPFEYIDPDKGEPLEVGEFTFEMEAKDTDAPTEVFVPALQYPSGFYVWVSDGQCYFDSEHQLLHWYPNNDAPGAIHSIRILPPRPGADVYDWDYFFKGDSVLSKGGVQ